MSSPKEITIEVFERDDSHWEYNIYAGLATAVAEDEREPIEGGICTSDMRNAIQMACADATELILKRELAAQRERKGSVKDITR